MILLLKIISLSFFLIINTMFAPVKACSSSRSESYLEQTNKPSIFIYDANIFILIKSIYFSIRFTSEKHQHQFRNFGSY